VLEEEDFNTTYTSTQPLIGDQSRKVNISRQDSHLNIQIQDTSKTTNTDLHTYSYSRHRDGATGIMDGTQFIEDQSQYLQSHSRPNSNAPSRNPSPGNGNASGSSGGVGGGGGRRPRGRGASGYKNHEGGEESVPGNGNGNGPSGGGGRRKSRGLGGNRDPQSHGREPSGNADQGGSTFNSGAAPAGGRRQAAKRAFGGRLTSGDGEGAPFGAPAGAGAGLSANAAPFTPGGPVPIPAGGPRAARISQPKEKEREKEKPAPKPKKEANDLTSHLIQLLKTAPYPDCPICYSAVHPMQPTWSCSVSTLPGGGEKNGVNECCWTTFHLKCIKAWAAKSKFTSAKPSMFMLMTR
jgi:hypothetical protein